MRQVVTPQLRNFQKVATGLLEFLKNNICPFICGQSRSLVIHFLGFATSTFPHFPSSNKNSLAIVFGDGAWVIRACSIICAGTLYADDSRPPEVAVRWIHHPHSLVSRAPKDNLGLGTSFQSSGCKHLNQWMRRTASRNPNVRAKNRWCTLGVREKLALRVDSLL